MAVDYKQFIVAFSLKAVRLKHIHLAGFKSFVDPVTIPARASLTGIVGPNGCGKSNVIDAVRWVLGESKARELRGETLQDVIFNGSAQRKPAARAVVELLFDNADGRAPGPWAQYGEISVKRVLTRSGDSSYHINNVHVRRRDVTDLILGTGLGGDAYAIIEQGTISRMIEARPDELRGHLEEAAGVSKYRERRRETENRLRDTRDNLERIEDIRGEMARQIQKLVQQAEVASQYNALSARKTQCEAQLAWLRRRAALSQAARHEREQRQTEIELEQRIAEQRQAESQLESERLNQQTRLNQLDHAQASYYAAGAEVTRHEHALRHWREDIQRLEGEQRQLGEQILVCNAEQIRLVQEYEQLNHAQVSAVTETTRRKAEADTLQAALPAAAQAVSTARTAHGLAQRHLAELRQNEAVELQKREQARRLMEQMELRRQRLQHEIETLPAIAPLRLTELEQAYEAAQSSHAIAETGLAMARTEAAAVENLWRTRFDERTQCERILHQREAELAGHRQVQEAYTRGDAAEWLRTHGLQDTARLWQSIVVEPGWEHAVEAVLEHSLAALAHEFDPGWVEHSPPGRMDWPSAGRLNAVEPDVPGARRLRECVQCRESVFEGLLDDSLWQTWGVSDLDSALQLRQKISPGIRLVTPEGHVVQRHRVLTQGRAQSGAEGILKRQREIDQLTRRITEIHADRVTANAALETAEQDRKQTQIQLEMAQRRVREAQTAVHQTQMILMQQRETERQNRQRREHIAQELLELRQQINAEVAVLEGVEATLITRANQVQAARAEVDSTRLQQQQSELALERVQALERQAIQAVQQAEMQLHALETRLTALVERKTHGLSELEKLQARLQQCETDLAGRADAALQSALTAALDVRQAAEQSLATARDAAEGVQATLQRLDAERVNVERAQEPLRTRLQALALKHQEAMLRAEQQSELIRGLDIETLAAEVSAQTTETTLTAEIASLGDEISAFGAVNLAALEELTTTETRKAYLDAQAADLDAAINTLTEAIGRIDAESRASLKRVYEHVSREFRTLFIELFGGGEAQLILTGDDILSAGLSIVAQPPGKKNSSIHLLSGGEKALTALSLVFALFRLNPAPFCLLDEVDAPLDDRNTERYSALVQKMASETQFLFITHNRITMEMAEHLVGVTMPEPGVSRPVTVDVADALRISGEGQ